MWSRREKNSRRTSSSSSSSQSSTGSAPSAAMTDTSSSSSLSSEFESMAMSVPQHSESKPCIPRTTSSRFDLCNLATMAGSEGASRSTSASTVPRKESILNVDVRETDGQWGQFVDVATWLEAPMPPRTAPRSISFTRPYSQTRNRLFGM
jgi:hypothetical protein